MRPDSNGRVHERRRVDHDAPTIILRRSEVNGLLTSAAAAPTGQSVPVGLTRRVAWSDRSVDLALARSVAALALVAVLVDGVNPLIRLILTLPMIVVVPGYALMAATCPGRSGAGVERLALSIGASLAVTVLGGLLLHWTPWGLQPVSWAVLLSFLTLAASGAAVVGRRRRLSTADEVSVRRVPAFAGLSIGSGFTLATAALIVVATIYVARASAAIHTNPGFTQVWMLPTSEAAPSSVRLGVKSQEEAEARYVLQLDVDGVPTATWLSIDLAPGESWEAIAALPAAAGAATVAEARLYRAEGRTMSDTELSDPTTAYRRVVLRR